MPLTEGLKVNMAMFTRKREQKVCTLYCKVTVSVPSMSEGLLYCNVYPYIWR